MNVCISCNLLVFCTSALNIDPMVYNTAFNFTNSNLPKTLGKKKKNDI